MAEEMVSCVEPAGGPVGESSGQATEQLAKQEVRMEIARAGGKAPQFSGMAYFAGGFKRVSLSDYSGKWTVLCFYPGDFTFV